MNISNNPALQELLSRLGEICECAIDREVMVDPVTVDAPCRHTVSREPATMWYRLGRLTCPVCGVRVNSTNLSPNVQAREVVEEIRRIQRQGGHEEQATQAPVAQPKRFSDGGRWGTYVGEVDANDLRHGEGKMTWDDGEVYEGEWRNDKLCGRGTKTFPSGAKYVGGYQNGKRHGHGIYQCANGESYEGDWKDGKKDGQGTYKWVDGASYEGEYMDGKKDGQGTYKWPSGNKYVGGFKADKRSGVGTYYYSSGHVCISRLEEGKRSGEGVQWSNDRQTAWELSDGKRGHKIDLSAASAIASRLGFAEVP